MNRRRFLLTLAALPLAPAALRGWAEGRAEALPAPAPPAPTSVLALATGEPLSVTVTVPPGRLLRLSASVRMSRPGTVWLVERAGRGTVALAGHSQVEAGHAELGCVLAPTAGTHTYALRGTTDAPDRLALIAVTDLGGAPCTGSPSSSPSSPPSSSSSVTSTPRGPAPPAPAPPGRPSRSA